jgi:predicted DNA-binding transcriptional regulator AlpA
MGEIIYIDRAGETEFKIASPKKKPTRLFVDKHQAGMITGMSRSLIDKLMSRGDLTYVKLDKRVLFDVRDLMEFMDSRKVKARR